MKLTHDYINRQVKIVSRLIEKLDEPLDGETRESIKILLNSYVRYLRDKMQAKEVFNKIEKALEYWSSEK